MDQVKSQQAVGDRRLSQLRRIHVDRGQRRDRQKYPRRRQPALDAPGFAGVGWRPQSAQETVIGVSVQNRVTSRLLSFRTSVLCSVRNLGEPLPHRTAPQMNLSAAPERFAYY